MPDPTLNPTPYTGGMPDPGPDTRKPITRFANAVTSLTPVQRLVGLVSDAINTAPTRDAPAPLQTALEKLYAFGHGLANEALGRTPPKSDDYLNPPETAVQTAARIAGGEMQTGGNLYRGLARGIPLAAAGAYDTGVDFATKGMVRPQLAEATQEALRATPLATHDTRADFVGEQAAPFMVGMPRGVAAARAYEAPGLTAEAAKWRSAKYANDDYRITQGSDAAQRALEVADNKAVERQAARVGSMRGYDPNRLYEPTFAPTREPHWSDPINPFAPAPRYEGGGGSTYTARDANQNFVGRLDVEREGFPHPGDPPFTEMTKVVPGWRRQGVNTEMVNEAEKEHGTIVPSNTLSNEAQEFWAQRNPELLRWRIRKTLERDILGPAQEGRLTAAQMQHNLAANLNYNYGSKSARPITLDESLDLLRTMHEQGILPKGAPIPPGRPGWMGTPKNTSMKDEAIDLLNGEGRGMPNPTPKRGVLSSAEIAKYEPFDQQVARLKREYPHLDATELARMQRNLDIEGILPSKNQRDLNYIRERAHLRNLGYDIPPESITPPIADWGEWRSSPTFNQQRNLPPRIPTDNDVLLQQMHEQKLARVKLFNRLLEQFGEEVPPPKKPH